MFQPWLVLSVLMAGSAIAAPSDTSSGPAAGQAPAPPEAACPHRYFPLEEGLKLTYRAGGSELTLATRDVRAVEAGLRGTLAVRLEEKRGETQVSCGPEGVQAGLGGLEGTLLSASGLDVRVVEAQGVAVPPAARMVPGQTWKNSLSVKLQPPASESAGGLRPIISTTFDKEATVVGEEEVKVAAGTFRALKVRNTTTARARRQGQGRSIESFIWFAPGVGIIKVETAGQTNLELLKLERPAPAKEAPKKAARGKRSRR